MHCDVDDLGAREAVVPLGAEGELEYLGLGGVATLFPSRGRRCRTENGSYCRTANTPLFHASPMFLFFVLFLFF